MSTSTGAPAALARSLGKNDITKGTAVATAPMPPTTPVAPMRKRRLRASIAGVDGWPVTAWVAASVKSVAMDAFDWGTLAGETTGICIRNCSKRCRDLLGGRQALAKPRNYTGNAQPIGRLGA